MTQDKYSLMSRIICWLGFEVFIPVFFVVAIWPISAAFLNISHAYEKTMASADLLPISAILLIGVAIDAIFSESKRAVKSIKFPILIVVSCVSALVLLFVYGFIKSEYMRYTFPVTGELIDDRMTLFSFISFASIAFAISFASLLKLMSAHCEMVKEK